MAFSSGTFSLVSGNPVVTGSTISSTVQNNTMSDVATNGLSLCLLKDGSQVVTANIPFAGFRLTGIGAPTATGDALREGSAIGATTRAAVNGTTGDFSSTLSVTGKITATTAGIDVPASALGNTYSSAYTPTLTNTTNVASSTPRLTNFTRVGTMITVSGQLAIDTTTTGLTVLNVSLPVASDLTTAFQLGGSGSTDSSGNNSVFIAGNTTDNTAQFSYTATSGAAMDLSFTFSYIVA